MDKSKLEEIKKRVKRFSDRAEKILDGDENYDGADGARNVSELCDICDDLIESIEAVRDNRIQT